MKFLRRLVRNGASMHVCLHPRLIDHLRWRIGDGLIVELTQRDEVLVRRATAADMNATIQPMTIDFAPASPPR